MFDPVFQGRSTAALPGGVAGSDRYPTLPPSAFPDLAAWFRFGMGITVTGAGVSQWNDASGNGRHLLQATDAARPPLQTDGSILFDGVAQFLKCGAFTLNQPTTVYLLMKQVTWTINDFVCDGNTVLTGAIFQRTSGTRLSLEAPTPGPNVTDFGLNVYGVVVGVFNGASSLMQINNTTTAPSDSGANNMGGYTLGCAGNNLTCGNIQVKESFLCSTAHDSTRRNQMIAWLQSL